MKKSLSEKLRGSILYSSICLAGCGVQASYSPENYEDGYSDTPACFGGCDTYSPDNGDLGDGNVDNGNSRGACSYMTQADYDDAVSTFSQIAQIYSRDEWLEWNGNPCTDYFTDIQPPDRVSVQECERCLDRIFDRAWDN